MNAHESERLSYCMNMIGQQASTSIGYPFATDFNYSELYPLLRHPLINLGDPFIEGNYGVNSFGIEREVVEFFADLFRAPRHNNTGYVTSGGSESNLYALYIARELYPKAIVYYSAATHYSVPKSVHLLQMRSIVIGTKANGEMDYDALRSSLQGHRHLPAIVVANIGTTMTEAKDNVPAIRRILQGVTNSYYIHCDAALAGGYLPLLVEDPGFDFPNGADSIACSGHKFIGSPIPCGVVIVKKDYQERVGKRVAYIGSLDTTITGSRNGHSPIFLWYAIKQQGKEGLLRRAMETLSLAAYTEHRLQDNGIASWRNENSITVVFPKPQPWVCRKWQLATEADQAHLICMPGISKERIDNFIEDLLHVEAEDEVQLLTNHLFTI